MEKRHVKMAILLALSDSMDYTDRIKIVIRGKSKAIKISDYISKSQFLETIGKDATKAIIEEMVSSIGYEYYDAIQINGVSKKISDYLSVAEYLEAQYMDVSPWITINEYDIKICQLGDYYDIVDRGSNKLVQIFAPDEGVSLLDTVATELSALPMDTEEKDINIGNLEVHICGTTCVSIVNFTKVTVNSTVDYFYEYLEPKCQEANINFSSVVLSLYTSVDLDDILTFR